LRGILRMQGRSHAGDDPGDAGYDPDGGSGWRHVRLLRWGSIAWNRSHGIDACKGRAQVAGEEDVRSRPWPPRQGPVGARPTPVVCSPPGERDIAEATPRPRPDRRGDPRRLLAAALPGAALAAVPA